MVRKISHKYDNPFDNYMIKLSELTAPYAQLNWFNI